MNIFKLDENPFVCARYHCDKHVPKMGLETTQLMNNAIHYYRERLSDNELSVSYFSSYIHKAKESPNEELSPRGMMWYYIDDAVNNGDLKLYKPTHVNHPCSRWLVEKDENFVWLYFLWLGLQNEYHDRFKSREEHTLKISKFHDLFHNPTLHYSSSNISK